MNACYLKAPYLSTANACHTNTV